MDKMRSKFKLARVWPGGGGSSYALVDAQIVFNNSEVKGLESTCSQVFLAKDFSQEYNCKEWIQAASIGIIEILQWGISQGVLKEGVWSILHEVQGTDADTTSNVVTCAAAKATWGALGFDKYGELELERNKEWELIFPN